MDKVRFGRALGVGTRAVAKTLVEASKAAAADGPRPTAPVVSSPARERVQAATQTTARAVRQGRQQKGKFLAPLRKFSSVLWLEVTGFFFAVFACIMGNQVWKHRAAFRLPWSNPDAQHLYAYLLPGLLFLYFAVSSFARARRRERR